MIIVVNVVAHDFTTLLSGFLSVRKGNPDTANFGLFTPELLVLIQFLN